MRTQSTHQAAKALVICCMLAGTGCTSRNSEAAAAVAPAPAASWWVFGNSSSELPKCSDCEVTLPVSGAGSAGSLGNTANDQLSPNRVMIVSDLSVRADNPPGANATRTFAFFARASGESLKCDITGANTSCTNTTQTLTVPAATVVVMDAINVGNAPATKVQFSWRSTVQ